MMNYADAATKREKYDALFAQMVSARNSFDPGYRRIGDFIAPYYHEMYDQKAPIDRGIERDSAIVNETPQQALEVAISGTFNAVCDPTTEWMTLKTLDPKLSEYYEVKKWLQESSEVLLDQMFSTNFYTVAPEYIANLLAFGTGAQICLESYRPDRIAYFECVPTGLFYLAADAENSPSTVGRKIWLTASQMVENFGIENVSNKVSTAYKNKQTQSTFEVCHLVTPNKNFVPGRFASDEKAFLSCYYEASEKEKLFLREEGFDENPYQISRWSTRGNVPYGFGLGHSAIRTSQALQAYECDLALAREKQIRPPMIAPPGVDPDLLSLLPGIINPSTDAMGAEGLRPVYQVNFDLNAGKEGVLECERRIRETFKNNIFLMIANDMGGKMTAREVIERVQEKRLSLTPVMRLMDEWLTPTVGRMLSIAGKRGKLPPYPDVLRGQQLRVQYKSVLAEAASIAKAQATTDHMLTFAANLAQIKPEVLDNYDFDEIARSTAENAGVAIKNLKDPDRRDEERGMRAEQMAAMQAQEQAAMMAQTAQTLSKADTNGKNALTDLAKVVQ